MLDCFWVKQSTLIQDWTFITLQGLLYGDVAYLEKEIVRAI